MTRCMRPAPRSRKASCRAAASPCCAPAKALKKLRTAERRPEDRRRDRPQGALRLRPARSPSMRARTARSSSARSWRRISTPTASTRRPASTSNMMTKGIIDPTKVVRSRAAERGVGRGPAHHHRGDGRRGAEEGRRRRRHAADAGRRRDGLLSPATRRKNAKAREKSRAFCYCGRSDHDSAQKWKRPQMNGARSSGVTSSSWPLWRRNIDTLRRHLRDYMP